MGYGQRVLLEGASFDVQRGEILVILGGSGSGKSSLMKNMIGLYRPQAGDVLIDGQSLVTARTEARALLQRKLGVMYQSGALFGSLTTLENVRFPLDEFTDIALPQKNLTARMLLRQVEMESRRDRYDDGVDAAIRDRLVIAAKRCPAAELAAECFRLPAIAARVARNNRS